MHLPYSEDPEKQARQRREVLEYVKKKVTEYEGAWEKNLAHPAAQVRYPIPAVSMIHENEWLSLRNKDPKKVSELMPLGRPPVTIKVYDPAEYQIGLQVQENAFQSAEGRFHASKPTFDRKLNRGNIKIQETPGGEETLRVVDDKDPTDVLRKARLDKYPAAAPVAALLPNGNFGMNDHFVGIVNGQVFYYHNDDLLERDGSGRLRTYDMLVMMKTGEIGVKSLRFDKSGDAILDEVGKNIAEDIAFGVFGQHIVRGGEYDLSQAVDQFDDLRHFFRFPMFMDEMGGQVHHGFSDGTGELWIDQFREKVRRAAKEEPVELDMASFREIPVERLRRVFGFWGYEDAGGWKDAEGLKPGEYLIRDGKMWIVFKWGIHPHNFFGMTEDGRIFTGAIPEGLTQYVGLTIKELAHAIQNELGKAHGVKLRDLFVWGNGKDDYMEWQEDGVARLAGAQGAYRKGYSALVVTPGIARSEVRDSAQVIREAVASGKLALFMRPPQDVDRNQSLPGIFQDWKSKHEEAEVLRRIRGREDMKKAEAFIRDFRKDLRAIRSRLEPDLEKGELSPANKDAFIEWDRKHLAPLKSYINISKAGRFEDGVIRDLVDAVVEAFWFGLRAGQFLDSSPAFLILDDGLEGDEWQRDDDEKDILGALEEVISFENMVAEETVLGGLSVLANSFPEICKDKVKAVYLDLVEREFFKRNSFLRSAVLGILVRDFYGPEILELLKRELQRNSDGEALTIAAENILRRLDEPGVFDFLTDYSERFFLESLPVIDVLIREKGVAAISPRVRQGILFYSEADDREWEVSGVVHPGLREVLKSRILQLRESLESRAEEEIRTPGYETEDFLVRPVLTFWELDEIRPFDRNYRLDSAFFQKNTFILVSKKGEKIVGAFQADLSDPRDEKPRPWHLVTNVKIFGVKEPALVREAFEAVAAGAYEIHKNRLGKYPLFAVFGSDDYFPMTGSTEFAGMSVDRFFEYPEFISRSEVRGVNPKGSLNPVANEASKVNPRERESAGEARDSRSEARDNRGLSEGVKIIKGGRKGLDFSDEAEVLAVVDERGNPSEQGFSKKEVHKKGLWHMTAHIYFFDPEGKLLLQKRSLQKSASPGKLQVAVSGHVNYGEDPAAAAVREAEEESGIQIDRERLRLASGVNEIRRSYRLNDGVNNEFTTVFVYLLTLDQLEKVRTSYNLEEVDEFWAMPLEDFERKIWEYPGAFSRSLHHVMTQGHGIFERIKEIRQEELLRSRKSPGDISENSMLARSEVRPQINMTLKYSRAFYETLKKLGAQREHFMKQLYEVLVGIQHTDSVTGVGKALSALSSGYSEFTWGKATRVIFRYEIVSTYSPDDPRRREMTFYLYWNKKESSGRQTPLDNAIRSKYARQILDPENPDEASKIREIESWLYGEHAEGLISTDDFHLVLEHIGAFCFGPVQYSASLAQLIARDGKGVTFINRNLKAPLGPEQKPVLYSVIHQMQMVLEEMNHNLDRAATRWLGNGGRFSEEMYGAAKRVLEQWAGMKERLLFLIGQVELRKPVPDFRDIALISAELAGKTLAAEIRKIVLDWAKRQPATDEGLQRLRAAQSQLFAGENAPFESPEIEKIIREKEAQQRAAPAVLKPVRQTVPSVPSVPVREIPGPASEIKPAPEVRLPEAFTLPETPQRADAVAQVKVLLRKHGISEDLITDENAMKLLTIVLDPSVGNTRKQDSINRLFRGAKKKQIADFRREVAVIGLPLMAGRPDAGNFSEPLKFIFRKIRQAVMNGDLTTAEQSLRVFENLAGQEKIRAAIGAEHELAEIYSGFKTLAADIRATEGWLAVLFSVLKNPETLGDLQLLKLVIDWYRFSEPQRDIVRRFLLSAENGQKINSISELPHTLAAFLIPFVEINVVEGFFAHVRISKAVLQWGLPDVVVAGAVERLVSAGLGRSEVRQEWERTKIAEAVFGTGIVAWLERNGASEWDKELRQAAVRAHAGREGFLRLLRENDKVEAYEILRGMVELDVQPGTTSLHLFLRDLRKVLSPEDAKKIPLVFLSVFDYVTLLTALRGPEMQAFLSSSAFRELPASARLIAILREMERQGLRLQSLNLTAIYSALPEKLAPGVGRKDIAAVDMPIAVYEQIEAALADERVTVFIRGELLEKFVEEDRLAALYDFIVETLKLPLDTEDLSQFYSALPEILPGKVSKKGSIGYVNLTRTAYRELRKALEDSRVQRYIRNSAFFRKPVRDRAADLISEMDILEIPLSSRDAAGVSTGLPAEYREFLDGMGYPRASGFRGANPRRSETRQVDGIVTALRALIGDLRSDAVKNDPAEVARLLNSGVLQQYQSLAPLTAVEVSQVILNELASTCDVPWKAASLGEWTAQLIVKGHDSRVGFVARIAKNPGALAAYWDRFSLILARVRRLGGVSKLPENEPALQQQILFVPHPDNFEAIESMLARAETSQEKTDTPIRKETGGPKRSEVRERQGAAPHIARSAGDNRVAWGQGGLVAPTAEGRDVYHLKESVVFSIEAADLAELPNWQELLAIASFNPRALSVAVTGEADVKGEARIEELKAFVKVYRDEQLISLPRRAPVFHFGSMESDADAMRSRISMKLGREIRTLIGIAPGSFLVPAALLDKQVEDFQLPHRNGFILAGERFAEHLANLFRNFAVISSAA
ncbi:MAG: isopentenyl-diphosphate delta-isomerase [Candidatus Omnitrophica bacterium ADurb.Bin277]|nr:MAG: isopentenyl-diphosphate delta-isomerase [Candidatus Omnitrophica bacterium ADurb.Bin277]